MLRKLIILGALGMTLMSLPATAGRYTNAIAAAGGLQGRVMWCDADANMWALDSREEVAQFADNCKAANINTIVVDVKPLYGAVLYNSRIAPKLVEKSGKPYPQDYDLLKTMVEEGHRVGIPVHAAINVFSEGTANQEGVGAAYAHPEWQCVKYEVERWANSADGDSYPIAYVNRVGLPGRMALITEEKSMPGDVSPDTICLYVDAAGKVTASIIGMCDVDPVPVFAKDGFVLIGIGGPAGAWLSSKSAVGGAITIEGKARFVPVGEAADEHHAIFVNPVNPDARSYELSIICEIAQNYDVDGIVLDRMRYPGMYADFSAVSRSQFEKWLGRKVERFPEDIFAIDPIPGRDIIRGKYFAKWMEWRAKEIHDFLADARKAIKSANPCAMVGIYVGSWYKSYYGVGVNWASPCYEPPYDWALPSYKNTGYADLVDWMCTGCYYKYPTRAEARAAGASEGGTVEAGCEESNSVVEDDTFVYGGLYALEYAGNPEGFKEAISVCAELTQGVMIFDLVYIRDYNWWDLLAQAFQTPAQAPHTVPGLIDKVKEVKSLIEGSK